MSVLEQNEFGQVKQVNINHDVSSLVIEHQNCQASVSLYGGHVLNWQPSGEKEVFWLSDTTPFKQGKAIRGGIPLCWPWFGTHADDVNNKFGNHGFARENIWQVSHIKINENAVEISLTFEGENLHELWPNAFKLTQVISFGSTFSQSLTIINLGEQDIAYTGALHSYFRVSNPENSVIEGLSSASFDDKLTGKSSGPQPLANGVGPIDRIYHSNQLMQIEDSQWQRAIEVSATNTAQWIFWNPGVELANKMADIHVNGEQEFVCLEAANTKGQVLLTGESQTISQRVRVIPYE